ncbi:TPA: ABC transporter ATP-binding protein, partial [Candidatus Poribacteria bacterium]|nr:ABC transporter ATP-binding protein [Candidatus Poribacteria bacterium]
MISTIDLTKAFGQLIAVDKITLQIEPGELFGFLGPNGAGKTTTINMLTGLIRPTSGTAIIDGFDVSLNPRQVKAVTGLMPDTPKVYETLTGRQFVRFMANLYEVDPKVAESRMGHFLEIFDLIDSVDDLIKGYSYGMQKKILLIAVLVH